MIQHLIMKNYFGVFKYWQAEIVLSYSSSLILYVHSVVVVGEDIWQRMFLTGTQHEPSVSRQLNVLRGPCGNINWTLTSPFSTSTWVTKPYPPKRDIKAYHTCHWSDITQLESCGKIKIMSFSIRLVFSR